MHAPQVTATATLERYKTEIWRAADRMALEVGRLLREAREAAPGEFNRWVEDELPFGLDTARRMMAISHAYESLPTEMIEQLPRPWQALYALRKLPRSELEAAVESGLLGPDTSERDAKTIARRWRTGNGEPLSSNARLHRADIAAGALMEFTPEDLNQYVLRALRRWLDR
jgi:hypothetical protein